MFESDPFPSASGKYPGEASCVAELQRTLSPEQLRQAETTDLLKRAVRGQLFKV